MKIRHKLMSVPGLAVVLMVALVGLSAWALSRQQGAMHDLSDRQFADNVLALRARAEAAEAHSSVYRMMNWVALLDAAKLKEQQTALVARLARAEASLGELRARAGAAGDAAPIDLAVASQKTYRKQALDAVDLASVDANTGLAAMQGADTQYQVLAGQLDAIVARQGKGVVAAAAAADHDQARMLALLIGVGLLAALGTGIVSLLLARRIVRPIERATASARSIAEGDLTQPIDARGNDEVAQLLGAMQHMQASLTTVVGTVRQNSEGVASASAQIANGNHDLSQRTEEQASALEETAASMEQLSSTVRQNADNARQANQLAQSASTVAVQGGDVVGQVVATMKGINDSSRKIADIIGVIDGIAFQTNILALNAAVEAARAGEQGRGFAVVAGEVRSLAGRSADAAKEIKLLINASVERVAQGTALVDRAGTTMAEVVASIRRVTDIMGEISTASSEQSAGVAQVGEAVSQMDRATQQNAALVEESAAAAESLKGQARELVQAVAVFRLDPASALAEAATDVAAGEDAAVGFDAGSDARRAGSQAGAPRVERRGPNRATNVTRPTFGTGPGPKARRTIGSTEH